VRELVRHLAPAEPEQVVFSAGIAGRCRGWISVAAGIAARRHRYVNVAREEPGFQTGLVDGAAKRAARIWRNKILSQRIRRRKL